MKTLRHILFISPWIQRLVRWMVGGIFIYAGAVKLMDPKAFARVIYEYGLVPDVLLAPTALGLPALELLAGMGLVFNVRGSLQTIFGFLVLFLVVLGYAVLNRLNVDCGCFSWEETIARSSVKTAFFRDLGLMGAVLYLLYWRRLYRRSPEGCGGM